MKKTTMFIFIALLLAGCGTMMEFRPIESCGDPTDSIIHKLAPNPRAADLILTIANLEGLEGGAYTKVQAEAFFQDVERLTATAITYSDLALYVVASVDSLRDKLGQRLIFASIFIAEFSEIETPITSYDRCLILGHIENQRSRVLALFK